MYSSVFVQSVDAYFAFYNKSKRDLHKFYVRPVPKRYKIAPDTFWTCMEESNEDSKETKHFTSVNAIDNSDDDLTKEHKIILGLFQDSQFLQVSKMHEGAGGRLGRDKTYKLAEELSDNGILGCKSIGKSKNNYFLTDRGKELLREMEENSETIKEN
jgi:predicted transcriptional regulator